MSTLAGLSAGFAPATPQSLEELGISQSLVTDLFMRRVMLEGTSSLTSLSQALRLSLPIVDQIFRQLRSQQLLDVKGMFGNDYHFSLTTNGRNFATDRFQICQYASACPVSLSDYANATKRQTAHVVINRESLSRCFSDLVVSDFMLDQLGPALISQNSIFLYGPSGNGKTSLAERMLRIYEDSVLLPYAVEVDNQIINLFDPVVHVPLDFQDPTMDPRWIRCRRPCIAVGGELVPSMLELRLDEGSGIYAAPLQMKANNGIFIVDDFGRQLISPRDLLNRWIVPLDRRIDYLTLRYGVKFQIPFELLVVFSTNLDPSELADDAFLRRIQNKIEVETVSPQIFDMIFERVVTERNIPWEFDSPEYLRRLCKEEGHSELRACVPLDIVNIISSIARYEERPVSVTRTDLDRAVRLYYARG